MKFKKIMCILLAMLLIVGGIPVTAWASGSESNSILETVSFVEFELQEYYQGKDAYEMDFRETSDGFYFVMDDETESLYTIYTDNQGKVGEKYNSKLEEAAYWLRVEISPWNYYELDLVEEGNFLKVGEEYIDATIIEKLENTYALYYRLGVAPEKEKGPIYTVEINDLTIPAEGEKPDYNVNVADGNGYKIYSNPENSNEKNGVVWTESISQLESNILEPGKAVFEAGKEYIFNINVAADDEYWFAQNEYGAYVVNAYVNGMPASVSGVYDKDREKFISISIPFSVLKEYDLIVEGGTAYNDSSNTPTESQWEPIDSAAAGSRVRVEAYEYEGWEFDHWEVIEGSIENLVNRYKMFFVMPESNVKLRAYYKSLDGEKVTFFHSVVFCFGDSPISGQSVADGETAVELEDPYQEGKVFLGWYTKDGKKYDFSTPVTKDITLTAKFVDPAELHDVIFCFGNSPIAGQEVVHGETAIEPEDPYQEGKVFLGWYTKDGKKYNFSTPVTKDITLTAKFECVTHSWGSGVVTKKATSTVSGTMKYTCKKCSKTKTTTIYRASSIKLSTSSYTYNGNIKNPVVIVKDSKGNTISTANYTVTKPAGRKSVGKYTYKITFKNKYSGTKSLTFTINPKGTSISSLTKASKAFTVKWIKQSSKMSISRITGYQVRYSTYSSMSNAKTVTVAGYTKTSKKITGLKAKKTYYVQVRTYKTVNGTKYYSAWSTKKSVKTK